MPAPESFNMTWISHDTERAKKEMERMYCDTHVCRLLIKQNQNNNMKWTPLRICLHIRNVYSTSCAFLLSHAVVVLATTDTNWTWRKLCWHKTSIYKCSEAQGGRKVIGIEPCKWMVTDEIGNCFTLIFLMDYEREKNWFQEFGLEGSTELGFENVWKFKEQIFILSCKFESQNILTS